MFLSDGQEWARKTLSCIIISQCNLYAKKVDCLGHMINHRSLHADHDKMARICDWRQPQNYNDVQKFLGLINYLAHFLPNVTSYMGPLSSMTSGNTPFIWRPLHEKCFQMIKHICRNTPVLVPVDHTLDEPIWVICDVSVSGVGAMYGQGPSWQEC